MLSQCDGGLYFIVGVRKAAQWQKVPRATIAALIGTPADLQDRAADNDGEDEDD